MMECELVLRDLDLYMDRELDGDSARRLETHLENCVTCLGEMNARASLRSRLKTAVASTVVSPGLEYRVRQALEPRQHRFFPYALRLATGFAALLSIVVGGAIAYQLGHLRLTVASQEAYIRSISDRVPPIMRVGLGDHVHCSVFRKASKNPPSFEQMTRDLGPEYKDLLPVASQHTPEGFQIIGGHRCSYHRRKFVHLSMTNGSRLISLVIAKRGSGEGFSQSEIQSMLSGLPVYGATIQRFNISAFETRDHLVYLVSDIDRAENADLLASLAPGVRDVLRKVEQSS